MLAAPRPSLYSFRKQEPEQAEQWNSQNKTKSLLFFYSYLKTNSNNNATCVRCALAQSLPKAREAKGEAKVKDKKYAQATDNAKESSRKSLTQLNHDSNVKDTESLNLTTGSESAMSVSS
jgi:hypothetical protein